MVPGRTPISGRQHTLFRPLTPSVIFGGRRNLGGSVGIATVSTIQARREQMDITVGAHVSPGNPETAVVMNSLCPYFISRGASPVLATQRAYSVLFRKIDRQASMLAYTTAFRLLG